MKKQILVFSALIIIAAFFTACEQDAIVEPVDDIVQIETPTTPPQEALDKLQTLIDSDFAEPELRSSCANTTFPHSYGVIIEKYFPGSCRGKIDMLSSTTQLSIGLPPAPKGWFYFHTDEKKLNGNYIRIDSGMKYGDVANWTNKEYSNAPHLSLCSYRAYIYIWDPGCNEWKRLVERYFT